MAEIDTPQFALPFRLDGSGRDAAYVEQDTVEEVGSCVEVLLRTPLGSVEENPDLGVTDLTFSEGRPDMDEIQGAIAQWEDRADVLIEEEPDLLDEFVSRVNIDVEVRTDG